MWDHIKDNILELLQNNVPRKPRNNSKKQPWITNKAKKLCRKKYRWFRKTKETNEPWVRNKYLKIKSECHREVRKAKASYLEKITNNDSNNKLFWGYVKGKRKDNVSNKFLLDSSGNLQDKPEVRAKLLNDQFSSVFSPPVERGAVLREDPKPEIEDIVVTTKGVHALLKGLSPFKSPGPDGIPPFLLKELADQLAPIFTVFFQASINQATVPDDWKCAYVSPIFKKGNPLLPSNYRPVSLTSVPCKLLEHIIFSHIMHHNDLHRILCSNQHGFRKRRSCESQLIATINDLSSNLDKGKQTDMILLDFSKAFDKVNHLSLLRKIDNYGIRNNIYLWIKSFLSNRTQRVQVDGVLSSPAEVTSGVPQGTVLGPLLFLLYINDLPKYVSAGTEVRLFADDSALYREISNPFDHLKLQADIKNLQDWESDWSMEFHPEKCQLLRISTKRNPSNYTYFINQQPISFTENAKYLGIFLNTKLSWNNHIDHITKKANCSLNFIHRNFKTCSPHVKAKLYHSYVRPSLEYSSSVWDPHTRKNINKIESVQRRAARVVNSNFSREASVTSMLKDLNWIPLEERRARAKVTTVFKARNGLVDIPYDLPFSSRHSSNFFIPYARTDTYMHSFYLSSMRLWNKLPIVFRNLNSLPNFQRAIEGHTITSLY